MNLLLRSLSSLLIGWLLISMSVGFTYAVYCPAATNNPDGNDVSTLTPPQGAYHLPADGSGLVFSYTSQLHSGGISESPAHQILLSLYSETEGRIGYAYSSGANPVTYTHTFYEPGRYYFVKNLIYYHGEVCTAYFEPSSFRPTCGTVDQGTNLDSSDEPGGLGLTNYPSCTCTSVSGVPYCRETLDFISLGSAEQYIEILDPLPTEPPTLPPTLPPTVPPTVPPTIPPTVPPTVPPTLPPTIPPTAPPPPPPTTPAYWQSYSGLVYGQNGVMSLLPNRYPLYLLNQFPPPSAVVDNTAGIPLLYSGTVNPGINGGFISQRTPPQNFSFVVKPEPDTLCTSYSYEYFFDKLVTSTMQPTTPGVNSLDSLQWNLTSTADSTHVAYIDGNLRLLQNVSWTVPTGEKYVVIVSGNVEIESGSSSLEKLIQVEEGGFFGLIAQDNITAGYSVGYATPVSLSSLPIRGNLEGMYLAFNALSIESIDPDYQFVGAGSFIGCQDVQLQRTFGSDLANAANPAELFIYRPDLVDSAPSVLQEINIGWQEVPQ